MTRMIFIAAGLALAATLPVAPAQATGVSRTFVSAAGSDSNNCANVATPCRHFQTAISATAVGGEVVALDPANYGSFTVSHAITIEGQGWSYITPVAGGTGITINAQPSDAVILRGLTIQGAGEVGIMFSVGSSLIIENCVIQDIVGSGIQFVPSATSEMFVLNTVVANVGNTGIQVNAGGDSMVKVKMSLRGVAVYNNIYGVYVVSGSGGLATVNVKISESEVDGSSAAAIISQTSNSVPVSVMVRDSAVTHNATGCTAVNSGAVLRLAQSTLTGNATSWSVSGGASVVSYADNYIDGNGDGDPVPPTISKK